MSKFEPIAVMETIGHLEETSSYLKKSFPMQEDPGFKTAHPHKLFIRLGKLDHGPYA